LSTGARGAHVTPRWTFPIDRMFRRLSGAVPEQARGFAGNLGVLAAADGWAATIGLVVSVLAGRLLGAEEFGAYVLVLSAAQVLLIPMICGWRTAALRFLPAEPARRSETVSALAAGFLVTIAGSLAILFAVRAWWLELLGLAPGLAGWALGLGALTAVSWLAEAMTRGFGRYRALARALVAGSTALLLTFLILRLGLGDRTHLTLLSALAVSLFASTAILAAEIARQRLRWQWSSALARELVRYSALAAVGGLTGTVILNADRFFLQRWTSLASVGVYAAYMTGTLVFGRAFQLFVSVYFPTVAGSADRAAILARLGRVYRAAVVPIFLLSFASTSAVVWLFGGGFPLRWHLAGLCALNASLGVHYELHMWLLNAEGVAGVRSTIRVSLAGAVLTLGLLAVLVPWLGIVGALVSQALVNAFLCMAFRDQARRLVGVDRVAPSRG
jgi:O-antigen/teichoic acid export membrane protein